MGELFNVKFPSGSRGPHGPDLPSPFGRKFQLSVQFFWFQLLNGTMAWVNCNLSTALPGSYLAHRSTVCARKKSDVVPVLNNQHKYQWLFLKVRIDS